MAKSTNHIANIPRARLVEIVVCFVDIRGFTAFSNGPPYVPTQSVLDVLSCFFDSIKEYNADRNDNLGTTNTPNPAINRANLIKPLGDGAMLVWEYPDKTDRTEFNIRIIDMIRHIQDRYDLAFRHVTRIYGDLDLPIGIGLSNGHAWKVPDFVRKGVDYVGACVNEAARLQDYARPRGIVANFRFFPDLFMERVCFGEGTITRRKIRGGSDVKAWTAAQTHPSIGPRSRKPNTLREILEFISHADKADVNDVNECDKVSIFDIRAQFEAKFAAELAKIYDVNNEEMKRQLREVEETIVNMQSMIDGRFIDESKWRRFGERFHSLIALYSSATEGLLRSNVTNKLYQHTKRIYRVASPVPKVVVDEHRGILETIKRGDDRGAYRLMYKHLDDHYGRARAFLLDTRSGAEISDDNEG